MEIDHLFIFSTNKGQEVDALVDFGFSEGSNRTHPGQGTANRKIYFEDFFLEIVWVHNESEIKSKNLLETKLWERSNFLTNGCSRFGLGFVSTPDSNELFENSIKYQPDYFPTGTHFDIITNEEKFYLPWTFRFPMMERKKSAEPIDHKNGIRKLTKTTFELNATEVESKFVSIIEKRSAIRFQPGTKNILTLEFDNGANGKMEMFDQLDMVIRY